MPKPSLTLTFWDLEKAEKNFKKKSQTKHNPDCVSLSVRSLPLAYSAKALRTESETQSGSGCVLSDFFSKHFFPPFLNLKRLELEEGLGMGSVYLICSLLARRRSSQPEQCVYWPENIIDWLGKWRPTCVMRQARGQKLQSFRRNWPFCMDLYSVMPMIIIFAQFFVLWYNYVIL